MIVEIYLTHIVTAIVGGLAILFGVMVWAAFADPYDRKYGMDICCLVIMIFFALMILEVNDILEFRWVPENGH